MTAKATTFKREMSTMDLVSLGLSAAIGVSIFSVISPAAALSGPAVLISLLLSVVPMGVFATVYAFLSAAYPRSGAAFIWPAKFLSPFAGFIVSWLRVLSSIVSIHLMTTVFSSYLNGLIAIPAPLTAVALITVFCLTNLLGGRITGRTAQGLTAIKLSAIGVFFVVGALHVKAANFTPFAPHGLGGVLVALPILVGIFGGVESSAEVGEEVRGGAKSIQRSLAIGVLLALAVYLGTAFVTIGVLGDQATAASRTPVYLAGQQFLGPRIAAYIELVALVAIAAALNTQVLVFARFLFAMGRAGVLPEPLGRLHPKLRTPHIAVIVVYGLGLASILLPQDLTFLILASQLPSMLKYGFNCYAAYRMVKTHPELVEASPMKMPTGAVKALGLVGCVLAALLMVSGLAAQLLPYVVIGAWTLIGAAYWLATSHRKLEAIRAAL